MQRKLLSLCCVDRNARKSGNCACTVTDDVWWNFYIRKFHRLIWRPNRDGQPRRLTAWTSSEHCTPSFGFWKTRTATGIDLYKIRSSSKITENLNIFVNSSNSGRISYRFRDIDTQSYQMACFPHPTLVWRPSLVGTRQNFWIKLNNTSKLQGLGYLSWKLLDPNFNRFWLIQPCDARTDGQTDRRTGDSI